MMTMKNITLRGAVLLMTVTAMCACTEYLDIKPYGEVIPKTADEFSSLLNSILEDIDYGEEVIVGDMSSSAEIECISDNFEANLTSYPEGKPRVIYIGDHLSGKTSLYSNLYTVIKDCNIVIDNLEERDTRLGKDVLGTAHAIRGVCYYNLLRNFCEPPVGNLSGLGVPLVTVFDMEARPVRSTIAQTIAQAAADMKAAIGYDIEDKMYRFNTDVMEGYLARLYFWAGDWSNAAAYARKIIAKYPPVSGAAYLEMMNSPVTAKGNMIFKGYILSDSSSERIYSSDRLYLLTAPVSKRFVDLFPEKEADIRYAPAIGSKRKPEKPLFACMRTAEMQLILAESLYHNGSEDEALAVLNELRRNRIENVADYTPETLPPVDEEEYITEDVYGRPLTPLLNVILNERRKELFMEGDRWYELKRNGRPEFWVAKQGRKYTTMRFMYTFPLPIQDIELVDGLIQNPGYDNVQ